MENFGAIVTSDRCNSVKGDIAPHELLYLRAMNRFSV